MLGRINHNLGQATEQGDDRFCAATGLIVQQIPLFFAPEGSDRIFGSDVWRQPSPNQ